MKPNENTDVCECGHLSHDTHGCLESIGVESCDCKAFKPKPVEADREAMYAKCFERIAKAIGIEEPLMLTMSAENDEETAAEILTRLVEKFALSQINAKGNDLTVLRERVEAIVSPSIVDGSVMFGWRETKKRVLKIIDEMIDGGKK